MSLLAMRKTKPCLLYRRCKPRRLLRKMEPCLLYRLLKQLRKRLDPLEAYVPAVILACCKLMTWFRRNIGIKNHNKLLLEGILCKAQTVLDDFEPIPSRPATKIIAHSNLQRDVGRVMLSASLPMANCVNSGFAEMLALYNGLKLAIDCHFKEITIATDTKLVIKALDGRMETSFLLKDLFADIILLRPYFSTLNFVYENRGANLAAHSMAKLAKWGPTFQFPQIFLEDSLIAISNIVVPCNDLM